MAHGGRGGIEVLIALLAIGGCFAAVAYAATRHEPPSAGPDRKARSGRPPKPRIVEHPDPQTISMNARFTFADRSPDVRFECRVDRARWRVCRPPVALAGAAAGRHVFSLRAQDRRGRRSAAARFRWTILEAKDFSIAPDLSSPSALYPGAAPLALPLTVQNPNSAPIFVTELRASVAADPVGCASAENLALNRSNASRSAPLKVPAGGSVHLPAHGVWPPTIQLRDLPINQDACKNARFPLQFTGSAYG